MTGHLRIAAIAAMLVMAVAMVATLGAIPPGARLAWLAAAATVIASANLWVWIEMWLVRRNRKRQTGAPSP
ncbi:hypothetical protein [Amycolatopsis palatopharyngis]|uniref:hypothetical protein n=1 Tax=Amycolatopsis palatopharyngis TaxID=187982 RepID=UPI000E2346DD|nr:hypothetical protein [Amycolatopsis palatopharyngis]